MKNKIFILVDQYLNLFPVNATERINMIMPLWLNRPGNIKKALDYNFNLYLTGRDGDNNSFDYIPIIQVSLMNNPRRVYYICIFMQQNAKLLGTLADVLFNANLT
jgi:hypothetical protein